MNKKQKFVIVVGIVVLIGMFSYPPWKAHSKKGIPTSTLSYSFIFDPPEMNEFWEARINMPRLFINSVIVLVATVGLAWVFQDKNTSRQSEP